MKKILIITPHYPPSNLAAVHRSRLFAEHLPEFGWEPIILTVDEKYYEEELDWNLFKLLPKNQRIEKTTAFGVSKPRLIGDIGLRGFFQLYRKAKQLIQSEKIDFLYIPIPSYYVALVGRWLHEKTGILYGIDYIDPWVHKFPGSDKLFSRHWISTQIAKFLEPIAVKKSRLITGVAEGYYKGVLERNPHLQHQAIMGAMPYGGEENDHHQVKTLSIKPYLFSSKPDKIQLVYAGAMLPKAYEPLERIFKTIATNRNQFEQIEFQFIGTGSRANDAESHNIKPLAEKYGLWNTIVFEYPKRIPYLDVLIHLDAADGVFILGSTEPHYTPSKTYQAVLSHKSIFAVLHEKSTASEILTSTHAGIVIPFDGENGLDYLEAQFLPRFNDYLSFLKNFDPKQVNREAFDAYSAKAVTHELVKLLNQL